MVAGVKETIEAMPLKAPAPEPLPWAGHTEPDTSDDYSALAAFLFPDRSQMTSASEMF